RVKLMPFLKDALGYIRQIKYNIYMILPLVLINVFISTVYYLLLFKAFGFQSSILNIFKIVSIAFTIGYFSPTPAGLGFKEGGLIFLLMQHKLSFAESATIAVSDRLAVTGFYAILAFAFGMNIIRAFIKKKFNNQEEGKQ
ncbi:MAG: flippase-like domain-containing protein, partial [Candidatus Omnitrophica bacterium]|nr:flippase-like domain-containing protein [Candidatus Omnitrophota bacterium]